jgi:hypothetical protein
MAGRMIETGLHGLAVASIHLFVNFAMSVKYNLAV